MSPWIILQYCNTAILQYCNIAILQYCNTAILQYCNTAIMFCSSGEKIFFFDEKNVHSKLFSDDDNYKISNCLKHFYCELMKDKKYFVTFLHEMLFLIQIKKHWQFSMTLCLYTSIFNFNRTFKKTFQLMLLINF